jgi:CheY-like chemotaxis protein
MEKENTDSIMIVDDMAAVTDMLVRILKGEGFDRVTACNDPRSVLGNWQYHNPFVIITDFTMPEMNGLELIRALQARDVFVHPVIITAEPSRVEALCRDIPVFEKNMVNLHKKLIPYLNELYNNVNNNQKVNQPT